MHLHTQQGYILSHDHHQHALEHVFSIDQFFKALFQGSLPHYDTWIVGQGLSETECHLLSKLNSLLPHVQFVLPSFQQANALSETGTLIQRFYRIERLHYQAEVYFATMPHKSIQSKDHQAPSPIGMSSSQLIEASELIVATGLSQEFKRATVHVKGCKLNQLKPLLPLPLSAQMQCFKSAYANRYLNAFNVKAHFYQAETCIAECAMQVEVSPKAQYEEASWALVEEALEKLSTDRCQAPTCG